MALSVAPTLQSRWPSQPKRVVGGLTYGETPPGARY